MSTVLEIESAIRELPKSDFWVLADRMERLKKDAWDAQIEADARAGALDFLFDEAAQARQNGTAKAWPVAS